MKNLAGQLIRKRKGQFSLKCSQTMSIKHLFGFWVVSVALVSVAQAAAPGVKQKPKFDELLRKITEHMREYLHQEFGDDDHLIAVDSKLQELIDKEYKGEREGWNKIDAVSYKKAESSFNVEHFIFKVCLRNATYRYKEFYRFKGTIFKMDRPDDKDHKEADVLK